MTDDKFWQIIEVSNKASNGQTEVQAHALADELAKLPAEEIADFDRIYGKFIDEAYNWDLWGAAYIIVGGCSDDGFTDFLSWLISRGHDIYMAVREDVEKLADGIDIPCNEDMPFPFFEEFEYVAGLIYQEKTGSEIPDNELDLPLEPAGEEWIEEDELAKRFPKVWAMFGNKARTD